jgi:tetratricopeptide (TPR) repeat protein
MSSDKAAAPLPRAGRPALASLASAGALAVFFLAMSIQKIFIVDLWWQLRTGEWIVANGTVPSHDVLSYTVTSHEWIEMRWLYCVAAYLAWKAGGAALLVLLEAAMAAAALLAIAWPMRKTVATLPGMTLLSLGVWAASYRFVVRPELVSYLMIPVFLFVLDGVRRGSIAKGCWALPALQVLWTNAHTLFVFGPVIAWTFAAGESARRIVTKMTARENPAPDGKVLQREALDSNLAGDRGRAAPRDHHGAIIDLRLAGVALAITAACWINPYFNRGAMFPFLLFEEIHAGSVLGTNITEFRSPFLAGQLDLNLAGAALLALASAATFLVNRRRFDLVRFVLWAALLYLGCVAIRNIALFAFVATWVSLRNLEDAAEVVGPNSSAPTHGPARPDATAPIDEHARESGFTPAPAGASPVTPRRGKTVSAGPESARSGISERFASFAAWGHFALAAALVFGAWYVVSGRYHAQLGCDPEFGLGVVGCNTPAAATDFVLAAGASPQIFHAMADGSYLTWAAKDRFPVYVDGRLEVYGESFVQDYLGVGLRDWQSFADRWKIDTLLLHREHFLPLLPKVRALPQWVLVHLDPRDMVFVRDTPANAALIRKYRIDLSKPWAPRSPEPVETPQGWRRWIGSVNRPWYSYGMAQEFLLLDSFANAATYLERTRTLMGETPAIDLALGQLYFRTRDFPRSVEYLRKAMKGLPADSLRLCELGQAQAMSGDIPGAVDTYHRALALDPDSFTAHFNLGVIALRGGDRREAESRFREVLRIKPDHVDAKRALEFLERER